MGYLNIEISGEKRGLKFDIGTLKCFQKLYDIDPFEYRTESTKFEVLFPFVLKIFHAALYRNAMIKKEPFDYSSEQVEELAEELDIPTLEVIANNWNDILRHKTPSANGEVGKDTQAVILQ
jgi:hypothetical protein